MSHPAILWERLAADDLRIRCQLCAHYCVIPPGKLGACRVRINAGGELRTLVFGETISQHVDPIEKKPLFHFLPGSATYSIATPGCNFRCTFCQNWEISQAPRRGAPRGTAATPLGIAAAARRQGCASIAYTYTEPTIFAEYALATAAAAAELGLRNVFVSNGYMSPGLIAAMRGLVDAINVDLKAGRGEFYHRISGANLAPVLANLPRLRAAGLWLEVTTLVIPGLNDSDAELGAVAAFLRRELGADTPWHISRFYPQYELAHLPPTPVATLERAYQIGRAAGLHYVYVGNVPGHDTESTQCPGCGQVVIGRAGYRLTARRLTGGACAACGAPIAGVGLDAAS